MNEKLIQQATNFLKNPAVKGGPKEKQVQFLKNKGLTEEEIAEAYKRVEASPSTAVATSPLRTIPPSRTSVSFNRASLTTLPDLNPYVHVKILSMSHNSLTSLPKEIGLLVELTILNASNNKLTNEGLPDQFFDLFQLECLNLSHNELTSLKNFNLLHSLQKLNVANNKLTQLPEEFADLQSLTYLWLQNNQLTSIPRSISQMTSLTQVVIPRQILRNNPKLSPPLQAAQNVAELIKLIKG